jgi:hypothetical protein
MLLQGLTLADCHVNPESDRPQSRVGDIYASGAQTATARPPICSVFTLCCGLPSGVVWARSIVPPHPNPCCDFGFFLSCPALRYAFVCSGGFQFCGAGHLCFARAGQFMPLVVHQCSCSFLTALHISALEDGFLCSSFSLLLNAFSSLAANRCCLESKITATGASPYSVISSPRRIVGSVCRMDLACLLRQCWGSSRVPTSLSSQQ